MLQQITDIQSLWAYKDTLPKNNHKLALVPTMGALHEGHLSLVDQAFKNADTVMVSIFVNPTQFAPHEDLETYPRPLEQDLELLEKRGVQAVWLPRVEDIYPNGPETDIRVLEITEPLEGQFRPHFFDGVATVVARLFMAVHPDVALFGEKDFQQLQVVKMLVKDLDLPIDIIGVPVARDENGLALSSRNVYLSEDELKVAIQLNKILRDMATSNMSEEDARKKLLAAGFDKVDYCTRRSSKTLLPDPDHADRALAAVWLGKTRLIDNMAITA